MKKERTSTRARQNVKDIDADEKRSLERLLGQKLKENQQIIIQVITVGEQEPGDAAPLPGTLPKWCNVYAGLSDAEISDVEAVSLERCDMTRPSE